MKKILCLVQLPPPVHGASVMNQRVIELAESDENIILKVVRLNYAKDFDEMHAGFLLKLVYFIKIFFCYILNLVFWRPNLVYMTFSPFGTGFYRDYALFLCASILRVNVKLHLHGTGLIAVKSRIKKYMLKHMFSNGGLIILSNLLYEDVKKYVSKDKVIIIQNSVITPVLHFTSLNLSFMYMANLDERKGVFKVLEIFYLLKKKHAEAKLHIVGADTVYLTSDILGNFISKEYPSIKSSITLHGALYDEEKAEIFKTSDIFIYPTTHDAAPLVVLEAQSYGLPVVCSEQGALPDMVINGKTGFIINEYSPLEYMKAIDLILNDFNGFSVNSRKRHMEEYSISKLNERLKGIFYG